MDLKKIQTPVLYMKSYNKLFYEPELYLLICSQLSFLWGSVLGLTILCVLFDTPCLWRQSLP